MTVTVTQLRKILIITIVAFAVSLGLFLSGVLSPFELKVYDLFSRRLNPVKSTGDIVIVQVDQRSIDALSSENITWPWPRQIYAPLLDYLAEADAVFIDILFTEPSSYGEEDDIVFADAVKKAGNVYLPLFLSGNKRDMTAEELGYLKKMSMPDALSARLVYESAITNIDRLRNAAHGAGNVMIKPDPDGVYRRAPLSFRFRDMTIPHFVLGYLLEKGAVAVRDRRLVAGNTPLPLMDDSLLLRYYSGEQPFPTISAAALFKASLDDQAGKKPAIRKGYFKGKKVFIGLTAAGLYDMKPTSISPVSTGVMIHATTLDTLLHRHFITPVPASVPIALMLILSLAVCWFVFTHHALGPNLSFFAAAAVFALGLPAVLFKNGIYVQTIPPVAALIVAVISAVAYSYATEGKERRFVRRAFAQYMDETIVQYLLKNPDLIKPGGQRRRVSVFFADIAGFTTLAEKLPPEATAKILHTALNAFSEVIIRNHGVIDKYIGDCIMAFWGAPLETEHDEINACRAALQCQETLAEVNRGLAAEGLTQIAIRIGIHSGEAIVGNLGSDRLFDYTAIGDTVNLASRLESANKHFKTRVMVSEDTFNRTEGLFPARELGLIEVKGKSLPIRIYELMAAVERTEAEVKTFIDGYQRAYELFMEKKWGEAAEAFGRFLDAYPGDGPAVYYRAWCETLKENPPLTNNWNVIKMTEK